MENDFNAMMEHFKNLQQPKSNFWKKYDDILNCLSTEQKTWVSKQDSVVIAKEKMFSMFLDYLFDQKKDDFVSVKDGKYKGIVNDYFAAIQNAADKYVSHAELLEKENQDLKEQLKKIIEERQNESMATDGSRRGRKNNNDSYVRADNDSGQNGKNSESIQD